MFGVVLWSDVRDQKAVIWCEDHGDLAFYRNDSEACEIEMDAGDWVQFDMKMDKNQRKAHNPRLVCEGVYPDLADSLCAAPTQNIQRYSQQTNQHPRASERKTAQIIPLYSGQATPARASNSSHKQTA